MAARPGPEHGDPRRYRRGCRCRPCTDAIARREKARVHARHTGTYVDPFTDSGPARERLMLLLSTGLTLGELSRVTGVNEDTLRTLAGRRDRRVPARISRVNAEKILAARVSLDVLAPQALIDATGTRRRLQALAVDGWHAHALTAHTGLTAQALTVLRSGSQRQVRAVSARAVRDAYERLWGMDAEGVVPDRSKARLLKGLARRRGWVSAERWVGVDIDDPAASPAPPAAGARSVALAEDADFIQRTSGVGLEAVAVRLGVSKGALQKAISRARLHEQRSPELSPGGRHPVAA